MRIQSVNFYKNYKYNYNFQSIKTKKKQLQDDYTYFVDTLKALQIKAAISEKSSYNDFIFSKGKVTKKDYENVIKNNPEILTKAQDMVRSKIACGAIHIEPDFIAKLSMCIKKYFDEKYDKNYRIISIGTSPAIIGETLQNLGADVLFVPATNLKNLPLYKNCDKYPLNLKTSLEYLENKGLKEENEKPKMNILLDFSYSGKTLAYMKHYIAHYNKISPLYITSQKLSELAFQFLKQGNNNLDTIDCINFHTDLENQYIEQVSNVPHFLINENDTETKFADLETTVFSKYKTQAQIFKNFDDFSRPLARAYSLCVLDCIKNAQKKSEAISD